MGSTQPRPSGVTEILTEYVHLRQNGRSQQEAIGYLRPILERLNSDARQQLAAPIRSWEAREGRQIPARAKILGFLRRGLPTCWRPTTNLPAAPWRSSPRELRGGRPGAAPSVEELNPTTPMQPQEVFYCPACGRANRLGDAYRFSCGSVLNCGLHPDA